MTEIGSNLLVSYDKPEEFFKSLIRPDMMNTVVFQSEVCSEEQHVEQRVKRELKKTGSKC